MKPPKDIVRGIRGAKPGVPHNRRHKGKKSVKQKGNTENNVKLAPINTEGQQPGRQLMPHVISPRVETNQATTTPFPTVSPSECFLPQHGGVATHTQVPVSPRIVHITPVKDPYVPIAPAPAKIKSEPRPPWDERQQHTTSIAGVNYRSPGQGPYPPLLPIVSAADLTLTPHAQTSPPVYLLTNNYHTAESGTITTHSDGLGYYQDPNRPQRGYTHQQEGE